ncbi:MMPL family transporter [Aquihabitans sp. G128]|uniref:MMPL family transporter n=1 Tax=Aquihabitans sp. G128 TaxID=2849779 RepID=UPI001C20F85E|nr:MMPL family transporter [Aquihabitans sp. G128]QXC60664.1 MMPL family transporter [Aquihabitans sp. G128]
MRRLGHLVVRRRRTVITLWILLLIATATIGSSAFSVLSTDFGAGTSTESGRVAERLHDLDETGGQLAIIADDIDLDDAATQRRITSGIEPIAALDGVLDVADPWSTQADALKATDGRAALVVVTLAGDLDEDAELAVAQEVQDLAHDLDAPDVLVGGNVLVSETFATASESDLLRGEAIALPIAIVVMVLLLGGLAAGLLPLLVALGGVLTTLAVLVAATVFGDVSIFSVNVVNMLGIGLGIDYGLLMVNRFREERGRGLELHDAVAATVASAGTTVVFSALTVAVAMSGLFVFGVPLLTSFGIAGLSVVLLCMAAAVTLLPATLAAVGGRISPVAVVADDGGRFYRLTRWVQNRPVLVAGAAALLLVLLGTPFLGARFEAGDARTLPRSSEVRATALALAERFPARGTDPVTVVAAADASDPDLTTWLEDVSTSDGVLGASIRPGTPAGLTVVDLVPAGTSQGAAATALVERVRSADLTFDAEVGGPAAELTDVKDRLTARLPVAGTIVAIATLVLLFMMTGSIIVPIKAVAMNILSLGASFGALVWIFQDGHLSGALGFESVGALDLWMPVLILIFAFGLSMDYEVFLLSRIKEVHDQTGDNDLAVAVGLQRSGKIITSAAALIVVVFAGFAAGEVLAIKQLGVGLAIAVIIDATLVRTLLVPATMKLLGERNWWAPAPLRRFHDRYGLHEAPSAPTTEVVPAVPVPV